MRMLDRSEPRPASLSNSYIQSRLEAACHEHSPLLSVNQSAGLCLF